jgi:hypothetical protein
MDEFFEVLRKQYVITTDRNDTQKYVGITIAHDRIKNTITLSMPGYVEKALQRFGFKDAKGANSPSVYTPPQYGKHIQYDEDDDDSPATPEAKTRIQEIVGVCADLKKLCVLTQKSCVLTQTSCVQTQISCVLT